MKSLSVEQIREADRRCIEELGIPGAVLMNNAGAAVFREILRGPVGIVCGKGNNGGDGFVVARLALLAGFNPQVVLVADPDWIKGDAAVFMKAYRRLGGKLACVTGESDVARMVSGLRTCPTLVDALLGTGIQGEVCGPIRAAIDAWPYPRRWGAEPRTIAVDVPSGLNADTGKPCGCSIRADVTVTFQFKKKGYENPAARPYLGRLVIADIGIPEICADDDAWAKLQADVAAPG